MMKRNRGMGMETKKKKSILGFAASVFLALGICSCKTNRTVDSSETEYSLSSASSASEIFSDEKSSTEGSSSGSESDRVELRLDASNSPEEIDPENVRTIGRFDSMEMEYSRVYPEENAHIALMKTGFITNGKATPFGELLRFTIRYAFIDSETASTQNEAGFGYVRYRVSENYIDNPNDYGEEIRTTGEPLTIDCSSETVHYVSIWTPRTVRIDELTFDYREKEVTEKHDDFQIQVFSTNDLHGQVKETDRYPGLSRLSAKMQSVASQKDRYNLFIDQGDLYQGTAEAGLSSGNNMDDFLIVNGYESTTLGNHEFDWGEERIRKHRDYLPVPILADNIRNRDGTVPDWCEPYKLVSRNGVKIGIIGAIGDCYSSISSSKVENLYFLTGDSLTAQIQKDSEALKKEGADFIILSLHDGNGSEEDGVSSLSYYDVERLSGGSYVDLVLEGHSHSRYAFFDRYGVGHVQNYGNGGSFSVSTLQCTYDSSVGDYQVTMAKTGSIVQYGSEEIRAANEDETMKAVDAWYETYRYGSIQSEILSEAVSMNSAEICSLVAKLYYEYGLAQKTGYPLALGGGFLSLRTPYCLEGVVTYGDVYNILPFENDLVLCSISGKYLKEKFIHTTNTRYYVYYDDLDVNAIDDGETYYILTDTYTSDYQPNHLSVVKNFSLVQENFYARDLLAEYLRKTA